MTDALRALNQIVATRSFTRGVPAAFRFNREAVYFLRAPPRSPVRALYRYDIDSGQTRRILEADDLLGGASETLSAEERARRERLRLSARGIVRYQLFDDRVLEPRILVPLSGRLFVIPQSGLQSGEPPTELSPDSSAPALNPRVAPGGRRVALVRDGDVYVIDLSTGTQRRLTHRAGPHETWGMAEFIAQEEMKRMTGFWWSPDGARLVIQRTDTTGMEHIHIADPFHPTKAPQRSPYPRPGQRNAAVELWLFTLDAGSHRQITPRRISWDTERYPYLATVRWSRDAPLTLLVQDRRQQSAALLAFDPDTGGSHTLLTESDSAWLNLDQTVPCWLAGGAGLLWSTERDGRWQLELRDPDGACVGPLTPPELGYRALLAVGRRTAWVCGADDPTQSHIWRIDLTPGRSAPERMTEGEGWHTAVIGPFRSGLWIHSAQNPTRADPPRLRREHQVLGPLPSVCETPLRALNCRHVTVGARALRAVVITPTGFEPERRYPVLVHVYGGPHAQMATRGMRRNPLDQWYADHGFVIVRIDARGTPSRDRAWERVIHHDVITAPMADQIAGLKALLATHPFMDPERVGIYGWSFGGTFSALAVIEHPEVFAAASVGAPVTDWLDYDTHYTERYLGLPSENPEGYARCGVLTRCQELTRPLLLMHGTDDDNVLFSHALRLSHALLRAGRPHEFVPLAGFTHMVADPVMAAAVHGRILGFFKRHLTEETP